MNASKLASRAAIIAADLDQPFRLFGWLLFTIYVRTRLINDK